MTRFKEPISFLDLPKHQATLLILLNLMNLIGFTRRHLQNLDKWVRRKAAAHRIETISYGGMEASYSCVENKEIARVRNLGGEPMMDMLIEKELLPGDIVYEVGANIGFYSVIMAKKVGPSGKVFAFEPETVNFERLRVNTELNGLANLFPCPFAASSESRLLFLHRHSTEAGEGAHMIVREGGENTVPVFSFPLDELVSQFRLPPPTVLKIDVEGHEGEVLSGMRRLLAARTIRVAFIEIHYLYFSDSGRQAFSAEEEKAFRQKVLDTMAVGELELAEERRMDESGLGYAHALFVQR